MIEKEILEKLKDIKAPIIIEDNSFMILISYVIGIILIVVLVYFILKVVNKKDPLEKLKKLDLTNSKEIAYAFSKLDKSLIKENKIELYEKIVVELEGFKYKKEVGSLDEVLKNDIEEFIK